MTDEEREAAIQAMRSADDPGRPGASRLLPLANPDAERYLDALLSEFVVIAKGDVIWVCKHHGADVDHLMLHDGRACAHITEDGSYCRTRLARTHWESVTTPEAFA